MIRPLSIRKFNGRWNRGDEVIIPPDHSNDEANCRFLINGVKTREGTVVHRAIGGVVAWNGTAVRTHVYSRPGEVDRLIILDDSGQFWDDSQGFAAPFLTVAGASDFSAVTIYNRLYIAPTNGLSGLAGEKVYVYEGITNARAAAGAAPSGFTLTATKTGTGNVPEGIRLFAVAYEYSSGYISKPGPVAWVQYDADDSVSKVTVGNIPVRPANVTKVHLLVTQTIDEFSGNQLEYELFFHHALEADETSYEANFYDSSLVNSADYLNWQLDEIPAGSFVTQYGDRLVCGGENANPILVRVSKEGDPESFSTLSGFVEVPDDGSGGVRNGVEFRGQFLMYKSRKTYVTSSTPNDVNTWEVIPIDHAYGTESHGVGKLLDAQGLNEDKIVICDRAGLRLFDGAYKDELSFKVDDLWQRINMDYFDRVHIAIDPQEMAAYIALPLDSAVDPSHILMMDFVKGMDSQNVRFSLWNLPQTPTSLSFITDANFKSTLYYGSVNGGIIELDPTATNDHGNAINAYYETSFIGDDVEDNVMVFNKVRFLGRGSGQFDIYATSLDRLVQVQLQSLTFTSKPARALDKKMNVVSERCAIKFGMDGLNEFFTVNAITLYADVLWQERPQ